ncbi:hypothetical protein POTOM_031486 [Populus tomentosa]|uniref:Uncharacterized protein n=1 Tax=Populus tomentosa TaxID=118781 RepID=A0A8X8CRY8_POPTO|nr:hypothetical protein POTOM_031486 [Populus tomentosa]
MGANQRTAEAFAATKASKALFTEISLLSSLLFSTRSQIGSSSSRRAAKIPIRANGADACNVMSDSTIDPESPVKAGRNRVPLWLEGFKRSHVVSVSGIPEFSYKVMRLIAIE